MRAVAFVLLIVSSALLTPAPAFAQSGPIHCDRPRDAEEVAFCRQVLAPDPANRNAPRRVAPVPTPAPAAAPAPAYKSNWRRIEADNGAAFAIDMNSIQHATNGSAYAVMCILDNDQCAIPNMRRWLFDCHGHYMDTDSRGGMQMAPSRSVAGAMAAIACVGAKDTRFLDDSDKADLSGTSPTEYCRNFSSDACARVTAMVNGQTPMPPCKPGFAVVGSGYTPEQIRACSVKYIKQRAQPPTLVASSATSATAAKPGEAVIGQWSGSGNGKSTQFHIERGPWEFRVTSAEYICADVYNAADRTMVTSFCTPDSDRRAQVEASGNLYFVVKTTGKWTAVASVSAPPATRAQSTDSTPANKAFIECLLAEGRNGSYATSGPASDGGKSTLMLMGQCKAQWDAWHDECIASGFTDGGPGGCTMKAYLVATAVLKSLGK